MPEPTPRRATCACGALTVTCDGPPEKISLCHCQACQRRTGSPFGIAAFFPRDRVAAHGPSTSYTRPADSGHSVTFHFCPSCGSNVYWEPSRMPHLIAVAVGAFADPGFPAPSQQVHTQHRHPWLAALAF